MSSEKLIQGRLNLACRPSIWAVMFLALLALSSGCNSDSSTKVDQSSNGSQSATTADAQQGDIQIVVVSDFADQVVIPTYQLLVKKADELSKAVDAFVSNPNDNTLKAAQDAWIAARFPWEQSEAFAFGPADSLGYDGDLDDWPVNETDVVAVLKSSDKLTMEYVKDLQTTQKGFHTIEYLLFGVNNNKKASDFSEREVQFLKVLTAAFNQSAKDLTKSWVEGVEGKSPYREVLATAGDNSNTAYPTMQAAVEEIVQGMLGCLDEVANEKIGEPLETKETLGLESRFSHSSLNDFKNNLRSVQNAYLGKVPDAGTSGKSLSDLIAKANPKLDKQVKSEMKAAIDAVDAIPDPIEQKVTDEKASAKMEAAQKAILTLFSTIEEKVLPIVQS
ncbi:MAG: imelysin family protein [Xenococcaceae cyanobacterium]